MQKPKNLPPDPGIYQFKDASGVIIYVGKAKNLKNRLNSYFLSTLLPKTAQMVSIAKSVSYIRVNSEFEALLLEANLIKKYKPKYNIALKDDKSPLYIGITKDTYPRIVTFRKTDMEGLKLKIYFGPYLSGYAAEGILKRIRKIFPYSTHLPSKKICLYKQLGLCDPCPSEIENETDPIRKREMRLRYLKNVRNVKNILNGKLGQVGKDLEKEIKEYSKSERFEEAQLTKRQMDFFERLTFKPEFEIEEYVKNPNLLEDIRAEEIRSLGKIIKLENLHRIECFDIAHLSGSYPTASMVVAIDGVSENKFYRHFKMYNKKKNSDVDSMREVITRRLKHLQDWGRPNLIIIDGGKPQLSAIHDLLEDAKIPFIGLAKRLETIVIYKDAKFYEIHPHGDALNLLQRIRDEAHRFARRLHHKQFKKDLLG